MLLITTSVVKLTTIITKKKSTNSDPGSNQILNFQWKGKKIPKFCLFHTNLFVTIITLIMWFLINNCTRHLCKQWYLFDLFSIVIHSFLMLMCSLKDRAFLEVFVSFWPTTILFYKNTTAWSTYINELFH